MFMKRAIPCQALTPTPAPSGTSFIKLLYCMTMVTWSISPYTEHGLFEREIQHTCTQKPCSKVRYLT